MDCHTLTDLFQVKREDFFQAVFRFWLRYGSNSVYNEGSVRCSTSRARQ